METYINKNAIVAEIETPIFEVNPTRDKVGIVGCTNVVKYLQKVLSFLDSIEAKEVDINKEISQFIDANFEKAKIGHKQSLRRTAKHFFELGLKAQKGE